jgi:HD-like signal output (HDOD) protein
MAPPAKKENASSISISPTRCQARKPHGKDRLALRANGRYKVTDCIGLRNMTIPAAQKLLEKLAEDLSQGDIVFPTSFNITLKIRDLLRDPNVSIEHLARVLQSEPIISAKLLLMANSAALGSSGGSPITELNGAIMRLGLESVKTASFALAIAQLLRSKHMSAYTGLSAQIWEHSILVAAIARQLSRRFKRAKPDEAFFAGLVHDIGAFYLLYYASQDPDLAHEPDATMDLMIHWHDGIGHALLDALGQQSEELLMAVQDHESAAPVSAIHGLSDILRMANGLANRFVSWHLLDRDCVVSEELIDVDSLQEILDASQADVADLRASLAA